MVFRHRRAEEAHPPDIKGKVKGCLPSPSPTPGWNTTALDTKAERDGNGYIVQRQEDVDDDGAGRRPMLLIARTTPTLRATDGLSLFY